MKEPEIEAILADIEVNRQRLGEAFAQFRRFSLFNPLDWRNWVARYPVESAVTAAAVGFVLAQPSSGARDGESGTLLGDTTRAGLENALLPLLLRLLG